MKAIGAALVVAGAALLGHLAASERERRVRELDGLLYGLNLLETEVVFGLTMLPIALERAAQGGSGAGALFSTAARELRKGSGAAKAWVAGIRALERRSALKEGDMMPLLYLGGTIGLSSAQDQSRHLQLARRQIEARLEAERRRLPQVARLVRALGLCGGLAAALMLV